jgi:glycosyltransferase involved in cell wall biosynthesis
MKIVLDSQIFNDQKFGGISRYYSEIYKNLLKKENINVELPLSYSENLHIKEVVATTQKFYNFFISTNLFKNKIIRKLKKKDTKDLNNLLKSHQYDLVVPTYYNPYFLEYIGNKPFVITVYDMIHEIFPQYFTIDLVTVNNKKLLLEKATKIIAISESTKKDILHIYPHIDSSKIEVVYLSYSIKRDEKVNISLPENYILFVGNRSNYKNFIFFLKSVAKLVIDDSSLHIVCAGGNQFNDEELQLIKDLDISNQIVQQNFEDYELATFYINAKCFVFASEYEGFGIPVLESMGCGCPVILANHSSFPEVAGDAGVYFELNNELDLRNKVENIVNNEELRAEYVTKGLEQVKKFSWEKTTNECLEVYRKAIS